MRGYTAELRKLWTTRTTWVLTVVGLLLAALFAMTIAFGDSSGFDGSDQVLAVSVSQVGANPFIVLIVALLAMTTEFRHRTIGRTLQLIPSRMRVLVLKLAAAVTYAVFFYLASLLVLLVVDLIAAARNDLALSPGRETFTALWHGVAGLVLTACLGVAVGALIRSQVVAITVSLIWLFIVENLAAALSPSIGRWLPFQALSAIFRAEAFEAESMPGFVAPLSAPVALATFLAYVVGGTALAAVLLRKRDV